MKTSIEKGKDRESNLQEGRQEGESVSIEEDGVHVELPLVWKVLKIGVKGAKK